MKTYFLGASNPETIRMIRSIERNTPSFEAGGFIDNDESKHGTLFFGYPVIGGINIVKRLAATDANFVNLITRSTKDRYETTQQITSLGGILTNFIHPSVDLTMVKIGFGNYIQEGVIIQAGVNIEDNCSIHMGALIGHETSIACHTFIAHAVSVSGCCEIGQGCFIGTNATILPRIKIGDWVTIGAGAVVTKDIPDYSVAVGNPARAIRKNPAITS